MSWKCNMLVMTRFSQPNIQYLPEISTHSEVRNKAITRYDERWYCSLEIYLDYHLRGQCSEFMTRMPNQSVTNAAIACTAADGCLNGGFQRRRWVEPTPPQIGSSFWFTLWLFSSSLVNLYFLPSSEASNNYELSLDLLGKELPVLLLHRNLLGATILTVCMLILKKIWWNFCCMSE